MKKLVAALITVALSSVTASAADLAARPYTKAPAIVAPTYNWTGFYVGLNAGGEWNESNATTTTVFSPVGYFATTSPPAIGIAGSQNIKRTGFTGGLTGGYNWQVSNAVLGIEADFNYFGVRGSASSTALYPCCAPTGFTVNTSVSSDWLATVRGRVGFLATPALLLYGTGGLAVANVNANYLFTDTFATARESAATDSTRYGWTAGAGAEYALMNGWSIKAEYLYVDLGRIDTTSANLTAFAPPIAFPTNVFTHSIDLRSNIVRAGINYKFGGPVVAKY
ncbi:MAG: porin family protein [bacterium]|nr:porin family protein [bacterium]